LYFSNIEVLERISKDLEIPKERVPLSIPMIFPVKDVFKSIYLDIVYRNIIPRLGAVIEFVSKQVAGIEREGNVERKLLSFGLSQDLSKVLAQFNVRNKSVIVSRFLTGDASRSDLDKLGVAKGIETNGELLSNLTDLLKLFSNTVASRIFIWIDDCERIEEIPGREVFEFQYLLRDILDLMPERLTIIMNFTQLPGTKVPERMTFLGPAVQDRIAKVIAVLPFDYEDYLKYIDEMLENSRVTSEKGDLPKYFPFTEKCLTNVFEMLSSNSVNLQPRTVNRVLSALLEQGIRQSVTPIDEKFLEKVKNEVTLSLKS